MDDQTDGHRASVRYNRKHPERTISFEWAQEIILDLAADSPAQFGKRLSKVVLADLGDGKLGGGQDG